MNDLNFLIRHHNDHTVAIADPLLAHHPLGWNWLDLMQSIFNPGTT